MAKRPVFFSFHFNKDAWRAGQVRNMGVVEGNEPVSSNDWEEVKKKGEDNIKKWIDEQLKYKSCTVVLVGSETAQRPWIKYEIDRSWELGKGVVGICIHGLKDKDGYQSPRGQSPFSNYHIKLYDSPYVESKEIYAHINRNIEAWVDEAISVRKSQ